MKPPPCLLRWTRFESDRYGTGPEKRSAQIKAICEEAGFSIEDMRQPQSLPRWQTALAGLGARYRFGPRASIAGHSLGFLGFQTLSYRAALARHQGTRVLLWETTYDLLLPSMARAAGFRVIALPHNLEALVSDAVFANPDYDPMPDLAAEVARLSLADAIHVIAKEERWFLEARGLAAGYLPYFPDAVLAAECKLLREKRTARARPDGSVAGPLLLLGSAFNPATGRGMTWQLQRLAEAGLPDCNVVVAGPKTDAILKEHRARSVQLLGRVSREKLLELFADCSAILIHTFGGAGAVTRIPEALLAGIPIIANSNAARDQYGVPGLHVYDSPDEFHALVNRPLPLPPPPPPPKMAMAALVKDIVRLSNPNS